jgi:hypothetical protein
VHNVDIFFCKSWLVDLIRFPGGILIERAHTPLFAFGITSDLSSGREFLTDDDIPAV